MNFQSIQVFLKIIFAGFKRINKIRKSLMVFYRIATIIIADYGKINHTASACTDCHILLCKTNHFSTMGYMTNMRQIAIKLLANCLIIMVINHDSHVC